MVMSTVLRWPLRGQVQRSVILGLGVHVYFSAWERYREGRGRAINEHLIQ